MNGVGARWSHTQIGAVVTADPYGETWRYSGHDACIALFVCEVGVSAVSAGYTLSEAYLISKVLLAGG